jgi:spectinomycin phosphotransferase
LVPVAGGLTQRTLTDELLARYGLDAVNVEPVAGGQDARASVYRIETREPRRHYLVKVRSAAAARDAAAAVSGYLHATGARHVVAPIPPRPGAGDAGLSLTVAPFIEGRTGVDAGLSERHWRELGAFARRLHETRLPSSVAELLEPERYRPGEVDLVGRIDDQVARRTESTGAARDVTSLWSARRDEILTLAGRTEELGRQLARRALPLVLCHADLHTWNVVIDAADELWVIDWDDVILAPKERDLMFVVGGIGAGLVGPRQTAVFLEGYGETTVDPLALSYYRHAWAVQDIGSYAERVLLTPAITDAQRSEAARIFTGLFAPGEIVALASQVPGVGGSAKLADQVLVSDRTEE